MPDDMPCSTRPKTTIGNSALSAQIKLPVAKRIESRAKPDPLADQCHHISVEQLARGHGDDKGRRHELSLFLPDAVGAHDIRDGDIHHRAGQHHGEGGHHAGARDE